MPGQDANLSFRAPQAREVAERAGAWDYANLAELLRGIILLFQGRADEAEAVFVRVGPVLRLSRPASTAPWVDAAEAFLHLHRGDLEGARRLLHRPGASKAARRTGRVADRFAALGWLAWEEDHWEQAAEQLADPMESWASGWQLVVGGPMCLALHVDALLRLGRSADATAIMEAASSRREDPRFSPRRWPRPGSALSQRPSGPPKRSHCRPRRLGHGLRRCLGAGAASCSRTSRRRRTGGRCSSGSVPTLASSGQSGSCGASVWRHPAAPA